MPIQRVFVGAIHESPVRSKSAKQLVEARGTILHFSIVIGAVGGGRLRKGVLQSTANLESV